MHIYQTPISQLFERLNTTEKGLSRDQASTHLKTYGRNSLSIAGSPWWKKILAPFLNLFMLILAAAATISIITHEVLDGVIILIIMLVTAIISYIQEASSERIFNALRKVDIQQVSVWRDGDLTQISSELVVPGDVVELREGQKVPADARLIAANSIRIDESLLTGESKPVTKQPDVIDSEVPVYEQKNMLFSGSSIIAGECKALIVATGNATEFGKLAELSGSHLETSPVQKKIAKLIGQITIAVAIVSVVIFTLSLYRGMELSEALRFVLALTVASIPESLPVSISVVLVLAARMLAKQKALVRNLSAIENIGIITAIATDKTGTLTKNQLKVHDDWQVEPKASIDLGLATQLSINQHSSNGATHDPLDTALDQFSSDQSTAAYEHSVSYPFNQSLAMSGNAWKSKDGEWILTIKGSPESLMTRCKLSKPAAAAIGEKIQAFTTQGFRVIAVAIQTTDAKPGKQLEKSLPENLEFVGLLAVADELREEASQAVTTTLAAGVDVRMITGDHFETAFAIGKQLGLVKQREHVFDCRQMSSMTDQDLQSVVDSTKVFSRVLPEYKHRILTLLKKSHIVAMTGDGVNDVPALTNAHIGIAMGSGSQVAKEAGDIVLLDNNFASIVAALRQGRVVFDNIQRMVFYLLSTNAGEILTMIGALILGVPVPLLPVQILWINIVTDTTMEIPLGLQPAEHEVLQRPPRHPNKPILGRGIVIRMIAIALTMAIVSLGTFIFFWQDNPTDYARTATFNALVMMQWANAFNARREWQSSLFNRSLFRSKLFYGALVASIVIQGIALFTPLRSFLRFVEIEAMDIAVPGIIGIAAILTVGELHKLIGRRWYGK